MYYRASDPTVSTRDWMSLSTSAIPQALIVRAIGDDYEKLMEHLAEVPEPPDWLVFPLETRDSGDHGIVLFHEPDRDSYDDGDDGDGDYATDLAAWKVYDAEAREALSEREDRELLPMWGTMWTVEDFPDLRTALAASGFRMYDASELDVDGLLIGIDGAGYSFYGGHWIPLRARLAREQTQHDPDHGAAMRAVLAAEAAREGDSHILDGVWPPSELTAAAVSP